jgi:hypothetical protein
MIIHVFMKIMSVYTHYKIISVSMLEDAKLGISNVRLVLYMHEKRMRKNYRFIIFEKSLLRLGIDSHIQQKTDN